MRNIFLLIFTAISMIACDHVPLLEDEPLKDEAYYAIKDIMKSMDNTIQDTNISIALSEVPPLNFNSSEIEMHEGCTDYLVYPGGWSGATISCGLDLGNIGRNNASDILKGAVSERDYNILMSATYYRGPDAAAWVKRNKIKIGRHAAVMICNRLKQRVWRNTIQVYPNIVNAPSSVQKAILMQSVLSGPGSARLRGIGVAISEGNWLGVADSIATIREDMIGGPFERIWREDQNMSTIIKLSLNPPSNRKIDYD